MADLVEVARKYVGQREVPGPGFNAWIRDTWLSLPGGSWFWDTYGKDDSKLPWCGAFVARCCKEAGLPLPKAYSSALSWASWGEDAGRALHGAVAVMKRDGGGHVAIVTGISEDGKMVRLLGGNQNDSVNDAWFLASRVTAWRKPAGSILPHAKVATIGTMSKSEA